MSEPMTEAELEARFALIPWREPIRVYSTDGTERLGCRFCIAMYGLNGRDIPELPKTREQWAEHQTLMHNPNE